MIGLLIVIFSRFQ